MLKIFIAFFYVILMLDMNFPGSSVVKNLPSLQETWIQSLGQEDPLEKEMATHFGNSFLENSVGRRGFPS